MRVSLAHVESLLSERSPQRLAHAGGGTRSLVVLILVFGPVYGLFMGSFGLVSSARLWQVAFSAVKIPLLLTATSLVCLSGFFVLNTVLGLRRDFACVLRSILAGQAALSIALASLGPLTRFFYFSSASYQHALLFNAAMFTIATIIGQIVMLRHYQPLIRRNPRHRIGLIAWLCMYAFVGMQMGWTLRPFIGTPDMPTGFFRAEPFSNAYVVIFRLIVGS